MKSLLTVVHDQARLAEAMEIRCQLYQAQQALNVALSAARGAGISVDVTIHVVDLGDSMPPSRHVRATPAADGREAGTSELPASQHDAGWGIS